VAFAGSGSKWVNCHCLKNSAEKVRNQEYTFTGSHLVDNYNFAQCTVAHGLEANSAATACPPALA